MFYNKILQTHQDPNFDFTILIINENLDQDELQKINENSETNLITDYKNLHNILKNLKKNFIVLRKEQKQTIENLSMILQNIGYKYSKDSLQEGTFSTRGNIIDIITDKGIRIEVDNDEIESIRIFDKNTLLSIKKIDSCKIYYLNEDIKFLNDEVKILFLTLDELEITENIITKTLKNSETFKWEIRKANPPAFRKRINYNELINILKNQKEYKIVFSNYKTYEKFLEKIINYCKIKKISINEFKIENYEILETNYIFGFIDEKEKTIFITEKEIKTEEIIINTNILNSIKEFKEGDLVVVEGYGIGIYLGIQKIKIAHFEEKEFVSVLFKKNRKLYFSVESVNIHKYLSSEKISERIKEKILSIPSFKSWQKKLEKVYLEVRELGQKILEINAKRYLTKAPQLLPNQYDQKIEESFEYELTEDQKKAINDVLKDLENPFPTNRLILADTGYGKTEVIIRAITRTISNSYKAILFVPTTILAYQHFLNIKKRLKDFRIDLNTSILKTTKNFDSTNLLISTPFDITKHKIENVGLVVLDEEHLMGVIFKESLKEKFANAHFLYSSATPIPRTYFMAQTGIIDVSIINTPPPTHKQPQTIILTFENYKHKLLLLEKIISKHTKLKNKIIYVNNNIDELYEMWFNFKNYGKCSVIHAQLPSKEIQKIFIEFIKGTLDIILSTTIIQSGIDTPEFDVMIIDNSHNLGISQIYQLRGRVGRGSKNPHCYIMIDEKFLNTPTFDRISIFEKEDLTNLDVVNRDLDIRGPGSLLSKKQSGHIEQIGLIQFIKMVNQYLQREEDLPEIECNLPTYLPESPIKNKLYRQLLTARTLEELELIKKQIIDVYGKNLPQPTINLLKAIEYRIRNKGKKEKIRIKIINGEVVEV